MSTAEPIPEFEGLTDQERRAVQRFLLEFIYHYQFGFRYVWSPDGDRVCAYTLKGDGGVNPNATDEAWAHYVKKRKYFERTKTSR